MGLMCTMQSISQSHHAKDMQPAKALTADKDTVTLTVEVSNSLHTCLPSFAKYPNAGRDRRVGTKIYCRG